jgi:hypothetical protein
MSRRPDPLHGAVRYAGVAAHAAHAPALTVLRRTCHFGDDTFDFLLWNQNPLNTIIKSTTFLNFPLPFTH